MPVKTDLAEARQRAIETLLLWEGQASNSRLREFFTLHASQAARDLAAYRDSAPHDVSFDVGSRAYVASETLTPRLTKGKFGEYANLIGAPSYSAFNPGIPAAFEHVGLEDDLVRPSVFRPLHQAIARGQGVTIAYASMSHPEPRKRTIYPHALIYGGPRWHLRAWCTLRSAFLDFNLGCISAAKRLPDRAPFGAQDDAGWTLEVKVRLVPHEALTASQQRLVRVEYTGGTSARVITRRAALVPYLLQAYRAALDAKEQRPPEFLLQVDEPERLPPLARWTPA